MDSPASTKKSAKAAHEFHDFRLETLLGSTGYLGLPNV
jgi:hypothetical protein